jgi:hypothetical protein
MQNGCHTGESTHIVFLCAGFPDGLPSRLEKKVKHGFGVAAYQAVKLVRHRESDMRIGHRQHSFSQSVLPLHSLDALADGAVTVTTREIMVMLTTTVFTFIALPAQGRSSAHPHRPDQLDYAQLGTEGVNINFAPVPEQLSDAVDGA